MTTIINEHVMKNLIYCEDEHSFVHRLYELWKKDFPESKLMAQESAWKIFKKMNVQEEIEE